VAHTEPTAVGIAAEIFDSYGRSSTMSTIIDAAETEDVFVLDVRVVTEERVDPAAVRCSTNDGCASTCASSCASRG
jgi:FxLD family lantipeptide